MNGQSPVKINRNKSLDYLRGIMATLIMAYHYYNWSVGGLGSNTALGRIGIYGVAVFYVLSGLTLYIVYQHTLKFTFNSVLSFWIKRFFRIFPLLWFVVTVSICLQHHHPGIIKLFLNYTGLFGFIRPQAYISMNLWSIGNELVFYSLFPLFLLLAGYRPKFFYLFFLLSILIGLYFAFDVLNVQKSLASQWSNYINPFNQLLLFAGGIFIGKNAQYINADRHQKIIIALLLLSITAFIFYPVPALANSERINLVTGMNRIFFVIICYIICFCCFHQNKTLPKFIDKPLILLGEISYSVYLLHPLVYSAMMKLDRQFLDMPTSYFLVISMLLSFLLSFITYRLLEQPCIKYGKQLVERLNL
jgi:exopolysaccharide production protein ExoZ